MTIINACGPTSQVTLRNQVRKMTSTLLWTLSPFQRSHLNSRRFQQQARKQTHKRTFDGRAFMWYQEHQCPVLAGFLETHGLVACNTLFNTLHVTRSHDKVNTDFFFCRQSHKSLLTDSRAYAGTPLDSNHRLLIAQLDLSRLYYAWSETAQPPSAKHARYNTEQLASGPLRSQFRDAVSESLPDVNPNLSASQKWDLLKGTLKSAAETTIGRTEPLSGYGIHVRYTARTSTANQKH